MENRYYIKISPENLAGDIQKVCYPSGETYDSGCTYVYSSLTNVFSATSCDDSATITGITIPILLTQSSVDIGYYSIFDGAISQIDVVKNFVFSADTFFPKKVFFYNTSEKEYKNFLELSSFQVDWGDGSAPQIVTTFVPNYVSHNYFNFGTYTITLTQTNPWGVNTVKKNVTIPYTGTTIDNPNGTAYFTPITGNWTASPISYDFIFTGDSNNHISGQTSDQYVSVPFSISGKTNSRVDELRLYGAQPFIVNKTVYDTNGNVFGVINTISPSYTGYTIQDVNYFDFFDGTTVYVMQSSGLTADWMVEEPIVKDEALINVVYTPEVQTNIFVERGKNSVLERIQRLGEVDNIGDLEAYGYGFFNFRTY